MLEDPTPCAQRSCRVVSALLVDRRGWLLLQERDEHAPVFPEQWGLVGGHVEAGETWQQALARELAEETGLPADGLSLWYDERVTHAAKERPGLVDHWQIWVGASSATDADIVLGEGRQIVFVDPALIRQGALDLAGTSREVLPAFLDSAEYRGLAALAAGR